MQASPFPQAQLSDAPRGFFSAAYKRGGIGASTAPALERSVVSAEVVVRQLASCRVQGFPEHNGQMNTTAIDEELRWSAFLRLARPSAWRDH
jgi:hypothetical protein